MVISLICLISLFVPLPAQAAPQKPSTAIEQPQSKNPNKQAAPEGTVKDLVRAWNRGDSESVAKLFLTDGVLVLPTGSVVKSRADIQKTITKERQGRLKDSTLKNTVDNVSNEGNTAPVKGKYMGDRVKVLGIETSSEGLYVLRQKKQQGRWMIAKAEVLRKKSE